MLLVPGREPTRSPLPGLDTKHLGSGKSAGNGKAGLPHRGGGGWCDYRLVKGCQRRKQTAQDVPEVHVGNPGACLGVASLA